LSVKGGEGVVSGTRERGGREEERKKKGEEFMGTHGRGESRAVA